MFGGARGRGVTRGLAGMGDLDIQGANILFGAAGTYSGQQEPIQGSRNFRVSLAKELLTLAK
jgi:hypothetical protein